MRKFAALVVLAALPLLVTVAVRAATTAPPDWAYAIAPPPPPVPPGTTPPPNPAATDTTLERFRAAPSSIPRNRMQQADWFPEDHPAMPSIVANGRAGDPNAHACSLCHYPNGKGRPENASVCRSAGLLLPAAARRLPARPAEERGVAQGEHGAHGAHREVADAGRNEAGRRILRLDEVDAVDPRRRDQHGAEDDEPRRHLESRLRAKARARNRLACASSRRPRTSEQTEVLRNPRSGTSSPMCRSDRSRRVKRSSRPAATARRSRAANCHGADLMGMGPVPGIAWTFAELSRAADVRHAGGRAERRVDAADEAGRREADERGPREHRRVCLEPPGDGAANATK